VTGITQEGIGCKVHADVFILMALPGLTCSPRMLEQEVYNLMEQDVLLVILRLREEPLGVEDDR
jgi:hypothetical protein